MQLHKVGQICEMQVAIRTVFKRKPEQFNLILSAGRITKTNKATEGFHSFHVVIKSLI